MKVAVFSSKPFEKIRLEKFNRGHVLKHFTERLNCETVKQTRGFDAVSVFSTDNVKAEVIDALKKAGVKLILLRSAGIDNIDLEKATANGIKVTYVPDYSAYSVAEHAVLLMLALNRRLVQAVRQIETNNFKLDNLIGFDMNGKTVGIIGLGNIGTIVAKITSGMGCKILVCESSPKKSLSSKLNFQYVELDYLLRNSDIITLHIPSNYENKHIINKSTIAKMKKGVMLINTARGNLINTYDLIDALKNGQVGSAGLDVYEFEKGLFFEDHSGKMIQDDIFSILRSFNNVLITGHQGFLTDNALNNIAETTINNLTNFENQINLFHPLN